MRDVALRASAFTTWLGSKWNACEILSQLDLAMGRSVSAAASLEWFLDSTISAARGIKLFFC